MPDHIQKHSLLVAEIALCLSHHLNQHGLNLNCQLVQSGALLHDIAKAESLRSGCRHEERGAELLYQFGYPHLSRIVHEHVNLEDEALDGPITESLLVNYADKRVKHDQIVTLEERFQDLIKRYARSQDHEARLEKKFRLYSLLENKIFKRLTIDPNDAEIMQLAINRRTKQTGRERDGNEKKIDRSVVGGRQIRRT